MNNYFTKTLRSQRNNFLYILLRVFCARPIAPADGTGASSEAPAVGSPRCSDGQ